MFIHKIGKPKHKFKARVRLLEASSKGLEKGLCFRVKIEKGSIEKQSTSLPSKKGTAKFSRQEIVIPLSLYYDQDSSSYLQKAATVKLYECDQDGSHSNRLGHKDINLANYAKTGKIDLCIKLEGKASPVLEIELFMERQDDDSKSVETLSTNNDEIKKVQKQERDKSPKPARRQPRSNSSEPLQFDPKKAQSQLSGARLPVVKEEKAKQEQPVAKNVREDADGFRFDTAEEPGDKSKGINSKGISFKQGQSEELRSFILQKALREKEEQLNAVKRQNEQLKKSIQKLISDNYAQKQQENKSDVSQELQRLREKLMKKEAEYDSLEYKSRAVEAREQEYEKTIAGLRQEAEHYRGRLSETKMRQAYAMQELFEIGDKAVLDIVSKYFSK